MKKILILASVLFVLLLSGCGRSDVALTVNEDGSFSAKVDYSIAKAFMQNDDVKEQVKSLITDSLDQNNIPYTETETDDFSVISVERSFADIGELSSDDAWRGIGMVPKFSAEQAEGALWVRYENGALRLDGTLDMAAFGAGELASPTGDNSAFGGSLTVILPGKAEADNADTVTESTYVWSGNGSESKTVSLTSAKYSAAEKAENEASAESGSDGKPTEAKQAESAEKENKASAAVIIVIVAAVVADDAAYVVRRRKKLTP